MTLNQTIIPLTVVLFLSLFLLSSSLRLPPLPLITSSTSSTTRLFLSEDGRNLKLAVEGGFISYDSYLTSSPNRPLLVYLPGLVRTRNEAKSINLQSLCKREDFSFLGADYFGVGRSEGKFLDGSVGRWTDDTIKLIDKVRKNKGKAVLVGHGMGAWISILIARRRPDLVSGIVGLSADPDFTEELLWKNLSEDIKKKIMDEGSCEITWGKEQYPISRRLIEDGRQNLLLAGGPGSVRVQCPVRLVHSLQDEEVPYQLAVQLIEKIASSDASLVLMKGSSSHAMEGEQEFRTMRSMINEVLDAFKGDFDLRSPASG